MTDENGRGGWSEYRPSKALWFWSCIATAIVVMVVGFSWGGWVTGGSAAARVADAREMGRAKLAAAICVENFIEAPDAHARLAALMDESSWGRDSMVEDAGWTTIAGLDEPIDGAADLCAEQLAKVELPPLEEASLVVEPDLTEASVEN